MSPRALVTGGAGFIGSHLCESLLDAGWEVECVDNEVTGNHDNLAGFLERPSFRFRQADINVDPLRGPEAAGAIDVVFHLACPASPMKNARIPLVTLQTCSVGTARVLDVAHKEGAVFVLASTSEVYGGDPLVHPQPETYWGNVNTVGPRSMYDEGKRFAETLSTWHGRVHGLDVRIVRIFNTYGPRLGLRDGRIIPTFVRQALSGEPITIHGDGSQTRSFCFVSDLIEGLVRVAKVEPGEVNRMPINLGNPLEQTVKEMADKILALTNSGSEIVNVHRPAGDPERRCPDISRAKEILGWEPLVELGKGLRLTIDWARKELQGAT